MGNKYVTVYNNTPFSALASLYYKEKPEYFNEAMNSIFQQTLLPTEIIIVHDGPLTKELYASLAYWKKKLPIKEVPLEKNVGLGVALNEGLAQCKHELIARFDTDDINLPHRFKTQIKFMINNPHISVSSAWVDEFDDNINNIQSTRKVPALNYIPKKILISCPINHPASIFRKNDIFSVGGYKHHLFMEDYYLWLRLYSSGYKIDNIQEPLVLMRVGNDMIKRRHGFLYAKSEIIMGYKLYELKLTRLPINFRFLLRAFLRLLPTRLLHLIYQLKRSRG